MQRFLALALLPMLAGTVQAQDAVLDPQTCSVTVKLINGTTGERGAAERVELREIGFAMRLLASAENVAGEVTFPGVELLNFRPYLAVAMNGGVAYRAQAVGQTFLDGEAVTVHVFDQTESLEGVTVSGMNVVVRRQAAGCELEYILTVNNDARPQRTVAAASVPVRLVTPNLEGSSAEVYRGPEPEPAELASGADGLQGPRVALAPGTTRVVVKGFWDAPGPVRLEIGLQPARGGLEPHGLPRHPRRGRAGPEPGRRRIPRVRPSARAGPGPRPDRARRPAGPRRGHRRRGPRRAKHLAWRRRQRRFRRRRGTRRPALDLGPRARRQPGSARVRPLATPSPLNEADHKYTVVFHI